MANNPNAKENLKHYPKGVSGNPKGAPPKIYNTLKDLGYGNADIKACFKELMWYSISELKAIAKDESEMAIRGIMAGGLVNDWKKGNLNNTREFLMRLMGAPTQTHKLENKQPIINVETPEQKANIEKMGDFKKSK